MADEMPPQRQIRGLVHLRQRFLQTVFAEVDLSGGGGLADGFSRKCLGDRDEADGLRVASRPAGRPRDSRADGSQVGSDVHFFN